MEIKENKSVACNCFPNLSGGPLLPDDGQWNAAPSLGPAHSSLCPVLAAASAQALPCPGGSSGWPLPQAVWA